MRAIGALLLLILAGAAAVPAAVSAGEQVDLLLVLAADVSRSVDSEKFQLTARWLCRRGFRSARARGHQVRPHRPHRIELCGMVGARLATGRDRLDDDQRRRIRPRASAIALLEAPRSFARPHVDQRRDRIRHGPSGAGAVRIRASHHRCFRRRHQQCRPRRDASARRSARPGRDHQWAGDS